MGSREENAMRSTTRRTASVLAALVVTTATVLAACGGATRQRRSVRGAERGAGRPASAAEHEPVTIVVGALRPGVTQEAVDALDEQIGQFEAKYPWITRRARGIQLDGSDLHRRPRRRHPAGRVHDPVHRWQGAHRPAPDRGHRRARAHATPTPPSSTPTSSSTARTPTATSTPSRRRPTACP